MFVECFSLFTAELESESKTKVLNKLKQSSVLDRFNTLKVYGHLEREYIGEAKSDQYAKYINFMKNPLPYFESEANRRQ